ncbi:MAG: LysR substrate-binding domain-containing protein, partial [Nocardioidaceae bacterium]
AAEPAGSVRVASFATGIRESVLPLVRRLARTHPDVRLMIHEHEPPEALHRLAADDVDLAVGYDYNLAPMTLDQTVEVTPLWETKWSLGVPVRDAASSADSTEVFARFADSDWIVNSRNTADDDVVRTLASMAGFTPRIVHRADTLSLVQDMIAAGLGVGLLPAGLPTTDTVGRCPLTGPDVVLRVFALTRRGRTKWPPLATVLRMLVAPTTGS